MLTLVAVNPDAEGEAAIGTYVPFSFRAVCEGDLFRWRFVDGGVGLLEFMIARNTGEIVGVTVVVSAQPFEDVESLPFSIFDAQPGLPVVNARAVTGVLFDEPMFVRLLRCGDAMCAVWGRWAIATDCFAVGRTRFLICDNEFVGAGVTSIATDETNLLAEWGAGHRRECLNEHSPRAAGTSRNSALWSSLGAPAVEPDVDTQALVSCSCRGGSFWAHHS